MSPLFVDPLSEILVRTAPDSQIETKWSHLAQFSRAVGAVYTGKEMKAQDRLHVSHTEVCMRQRALVTRAAIVSQ